MKNYTDSDYALNKYSEGIVYRFADGIVEVILADFLAENPGKTEVDFRALKELSDSIYLEQVQAENAQTKKNSPFDELEETTPNHVPSPEESFIDEINAKETAKMRNQQIALANFTLDKLTETQRRRYLLYHVEGLSTWEIAKREGVNQSKIMNSLTLADKKIKKVLADSKK
jgi:DNA-directed RNA polymerase specialized sigma subunit